MWDKYFTSCGSHTNRNDTHESSSYISNNIGKMTSVFPMSVGGGCVNCIKQLFCSHPILSAVFFHDSIQKIKN
jgi:hypothetical protein